MIRAAVGVCGSGKTYRLQTVAARSLAATQADPRRAGWRFLIVDINGEWPGAPADEVSRRIGRPLEYVGATSPIDAHRALEAGATAVVLRPGLMGSETAARELADACAWSATTLGARAPAGSGVCLVLPEAHQYAAEGRPLPSHLRVIVHRFRHTQTGLLLDTQHFQDLRKEILRECETLYLHAQAHATDLERVERYGGRELRAAVEEAARRLADAQAAGRPADGAGWHVRFRCHLGGPPPFELVR